MPSTLRPTSAGETTACSMANTPSSEPSRRSAMHRPTTPSSRRRWDSLKVSSGTCPRPRASRWRTGTRRPMARWPSTSNGHLKGGIGAGASLAAVAQIGVVGGPAGLALLVGLSAGILVNRATEKVSVVQIGQFVAERAAVAATETKRLADRYARTAEAVPTNGLG